LWTQAGITVIFGLVHGTAFASGLLEFQISRQLLVPALAGFNVGIELGQLSFIAVVLFATAALRRLIVPATVNKIGIAAAFLLCCTSTWWFVDRIGSL
jgi:hypothetical protein